MMEKYNFSGHPVAGFEVAPLVGVNLPTDGEALRRYVRELISTLPGRDRLLAGAPVEVILPGLSWAAGAVMAEWHGQFGSFPTIRWSVRGEGGFVWPDTARTDLQDVRDSARLQR